MRLLLLFPFIILIGKLIHALIYRIRSKSGVQKTEYLILGGIEQYIQTRGQNAANPVIIMLHGGPGSNMAYYSYKWQAELEQDYTIIHWDQRGCGNTYFRNPDAAKPTLDLLLSDLDELVDYARTTYGKETVLILGHSWGTFLGGIYCGKHPEKVSAYLSVGQMTDLKKSEQVSALEAMRRANEAGKARDAQNIKEHLEFIITCHQLGKSEATQLMKLRQLKEKYLPAQYGNQIILLYLFSPYMTWGDLKWLFCFHKRIETNSELYQLLLSEQGSTMYDYTLQYEFPVIMIMGENDRTTPYPLVLSYFNDISAPYKEFAIIERAGHIPFADKPKDFSKALLRALKRACSYG